MTNRPFAVAVAAAAFFVGPSRGFRVEAQVAAVGPASSAEGFQVIGMEKFRRIMASREGIVVDARTEDSYRAGHVPGAMNLPRYKVIVSPGEVEARLPKERLLVVYCDNQECEDADLEAKGLVKLGYRVAIFRGGMQEWRENHLPEERTPSPEKMELRGGAHGIELGPDTTRSELND